MKLRADVVKNVPELCRYFSPRARAGDLKIRGDVLEGLLSMKKYRHENSGAQNFSIPGAERARAGRPVRPRQGDEKSLACEFAVCGACNRGALCSVRARVPQLRPDGLRPRDAPNDQFLAVNRTTAAA